MSAPRRLPFDDGLRSGLRIYARRAGAVVSVGVVGCLALLLVAAALLFVAIIVGFLWDVASVVWAEELP